MFAKAGRMGRTLAKEYVDLIHKKDKLFDFSTDDPNRKKELELIWGVKMGVRETLYLEDQRGARKMVCDSGVDPVLLGHS